MDKRKNSKNVNNNMPAVKKAGPIVGFLASLVAAFGMGSVVQNNKNDNQYRENKMNESSIENLIDKAEKMCKQATQTESTIDDQISKQILALVYGYDEIYNEIDPSSDKEKVNDMLTRMYFLLRDCTSVTLEPVNDLNLDSSDLIVTDDKQNFLETITGKEPEKIIKISNDDCSYSFALADMTSPEYQEFYLSTHALQEEKAKKPAQVIERTSVLLDKYAEAMESGILDNAVIRTALEQQNYETIKELDQDGLLSLIKTYYVSEYNRIHNTDLKAKGIYILDQEQVGRCNFKFEDGKILEASSPENHFDGYVIYDGYELVFDHNTDTNNPAYTSTHIIDGYGKRADHSTVYDNSSTSNEQYYASVYNYDETNFDVESAAQNCFEILEKGLALHNYLGHTKKTNETKEKIETLSRELATAITEYAKLHPQEQTQEVSYHAPSFIDSLHVSETTLENSYSNKTTFLAEEHDVSDDDNLEL